MTTSTTASRREPDIATVRSAAAERWPQLELDALVQMVRVTGDRRAAAEEAAGMAPGLTVDDALATPYLALGTTGEIAEQLLAARDRWGISYFAVRDLDAFAPVIARLRR